MVDLPVSNTPSTKVMNNIQIDAVDNRISADW